MGLLGNVAEVQHLRSKLMVSDFVLVFADLLDSQSDGIEVNYHHNIDLCDSNPQNIR